jgi:hypothetical protein
LDEDPVVAQVVGVSFVLEAETLVRLGARVRLLAGALPVGAASLASLVLPAGKTQTVVLKEEAKRVSSARFSTFWFLRTPKPNILSEITYPSSF